MGTLMLGFPRLTPKIYYLKSIYFEAIKHLSEEFIDLGWTQSDINNHFN